MDCIWHENSYSFLSIPSALLAIVCKFISRGFAWVENAYSSLCIDFPWLENSNSFLSIVFIWLGVGLLIHIVP